MSTSTSVAPEAGRSFPAEADEFDLLRDAVERELPIAARSEIVRQGGRPRAAYLLLEGQAYRSRLLTGGRRQITALFVRGDICDVGAVLRGRADSSILALTSCTVGEIPEQRLHTIDGRANPAMQCALYRQLLRDEAIAREWMIGLGRRSAAERLAHLLCELRVRVVRVGLNYSRSNSLGLTQTQLADALGISSVHVNRTLMQLRHRNLITFEDGAIRIINDTALEELAGFDPTYLD